AYNSLQAFGAVQKVVSNNNTTGTAVTTMKDWTALTLSSPIETSTIATTPISNAENALNHVGGLPLPDMAIDMVSDMESVVVNTKITVASKNKNPNIVPNGSCSVMAIIAAGGPASFNAVDTEPGIFSSSKMPVPPTTVNQKAVISGAIMATANTNSRCKHCHHWAISNKPCKEEYCPKAKPSIIRSVRIK